MAIAESLQGSSTQSERLGGEPRGVALSVVVPARNESGNVEALANEVVETLRGRVEFEMIFVDDASDDATAQILGRLMKTLPELRVLRHTSRAGQSAALRNGVRAARSEWIATLDGDGQNDPADLLQLIARRNESAADVKLFAGWRIARRDNFSKRVASRFANALRSRLLRDATPDTGCGTKLFERAAFLELPFFNHMHRYLPALMQRDGWRTLSVPVNHRPRAAGRSNYNNLQRAWVGLSDLRGVSWLIRRSARVTVREISRPET